MNRTQSQEFGRIAQDFYKTITPKRIRTFSENMLERQKPFLKFEDGPNSPTFLRTSSNNSINSKQQLQAQCNHFCNKNYAKQDFIKDYHPKARSVSCCENMSRKKIETDEEAKMWQRIKNDIKKMKKCHKSSREVSADQLITKNMETQTIETTNYRALSQTSGYYSEESISSFLESEISIGNLIEHEQPLKNSTLIYSQEASITEKYSLADITNKTQSHLLPDHRGALEAKAKLCKSTENNQKHINGHSDWRQKCFLCHPPNIQIPLIIINEIDVVDKTLEKETTKISKFKTLKVPQIPKPSKYEENKELQEKIAQEEFVKQIRIKDKVLANLLEIAHYPDFPNLKHVCNVECQKDKDGSCNKTKKQQTDINRQSHVGIFGYIWSAIKYRLVSNNQINVEKKEGPQTTEDEEKNGNSKEKSHIEKEEQLKPIETEKLIEENQNDCFKDNEGEENKKNNIEEQKSSSDLKQIKNETEDLQENVEKNNILETNNTSKAFDLENAENNENKLENISEKENENKLNEGKGLKNSTRDLNKNESNETNGTATELEDPQAKQTSINHVEKIKQRICLENQVGVKNEQDLKTNVDNNKSLAEKNDVKEIKSKKRFLSFFRKATKNKAKENPKENSKENLSTIESMEEKFKDIVKAENKISKEALEKLENFVAIKNKQKSIETNIKTKRSDSF